MHKKKTILFFLFSLLFLFSCKNSSKYYNKNINVYSFIDSDSNISIQEVYNQYKTFNKEDPNCAFGFVKGTLWLAIEIPKAFTKFYLDIGPEPIDRADLYYINYTNNITLFDSCGRNIPVSDRKTVTWRQGLSIPLSSYNPVVFLKIQNFDSTAISLRFFTEIEYLQSTINMTTIHGIIFSFFVLCIIGLIIALCIFKTKRILYLMLMTLCFFFYLIMITGFGSTYILNQFANSQFIGRLSYIFSSLGEWFIILLFTDTSENEKIRKINKIIKIFFSITSVFFIITFAITPNINFIYQSSLLVLLLGSFIVIALSIYKYISTKNTDNLKLLIAWIPLVVYSSFRQAYHLIRDTNSIELLDRLFDNDYYFSYEICFLFQIIMYIYLTFSVIYRAHKKYLDNSRKSVQIEPPIESNKIDKQSLYTQFNLTKRETEIVKLLQQNNMTTNQIAETLGISKETVASHVKHILSKTKTNSRLDLLRLLMK